MASSMDGKNNICVWCGASIREIGAVGNDVDDWRSVQGILRAPHGQQKNRHLSGSKGERTHVKARLVAMTGRDGMGRSLKLGCLVLGQGMG
jgi:hypothetical protein